MNKKNKNILYIALGILIVVVAAWCIKNNGDKQGANNHEGTASSTDMTASSTVKNNTTVKTNTNTNTAVKNIPGYPSSWPSDVPKYPVERVNYSGGNNPQSGPTEASVVFTTNNSVKSVVDFYLTNLVANGWKITENGNGTANMTTFRASKAGRSVGGYAVKEANGKTLVTIGVNVGL